MLKQFEGEKRLSASAAPEEKGKKEMWLLCPRCEEPFMKNMRAEKATPGGIYKTKCPKCRYVRKCIIMRPA